MKREDDYRLRRWRARPWMVHDRVTDGIAQPKLKFFPDSFGSSRNACSALRT